MKFQLCGTETRQPKRLFAAAGRGARLAQRAIRLATWLDKSHQGGQYSIENAMTSKACSVWVARKT